LVEQRIENPRVTGSIPVQATKFNRCITFCNTAVFFCLTYFIQSSKNMRSPTSIVDVDRVESWTRYKPGMCNSCAANCCTMPVEVKMADLIRLNLVDPFEAEHEEPKQIAKRLSKQGLIDHFNFKNSIFTLARRSSGDCQFLDAKDRHCTVYANRPNTCRTHPQVGPKPGFCPYGALATQKQSHN
jgi:Fe-S-cluster containining protein